MALGPFDENWLIYHLQVNICIFYVVNQIIIDLYFSEYF